MSWSCFQISVKYLYIYTILYIIYIIVYIYYIKDIRREYISLPCFFLSVEKRKPKSFLRNDNNEKKNYVYKYKILFAFIHGKRGKRV